MPNILDVISDQNDRIINDLCDVSEQVDRICEWVDRFIERMQDFNERYGDESEVTFNITRQLDTLENGKHTLTNLKERIDACAELE